jgi:hypothetical protein
MSRLLATRKLAQTELQVCALLVGSWKIEAYSSNLAELPGLSGTLVISSWDPATSAFDGTLTLNKVPICTVRASIPCGPIAVRFCWFGSA